jgi:hypothetical protein
VRGQATWIRSARADTGVALAWIPFALAVAAARSDGRSLAAFLEALSLFSFVHQPLTLPLVYGDESQFAARRRLFIWAPLVLAGVIALGLTISFTLVAVVGGLWNMEHTLMQRYGFVRIYGRRAGQEDGHVERTMLLCWLVVTLLSVAADSRTPERIASLPLGRVNSDALNVLASWRPYATALLLPSVVAAAAVTIRWIRSERARRASGTANNAKVLYLASTAAMFTWAVLVDPVAGLAGYAGAHAVEYFFIVDHRLSSKRTPSSRRRFFAGYLTLFGLLYFVAFNTEVWTLCVLFFGGLHFLFDGFIWRSRKPAGSAVQPMAANVNA